MKRKRGYVSQHFHVGECHTGFDTEHNGCVRCQRAHARTWPGRTGRARARGAGPRPHARIKSMHTISTVKKDQPDSNHIPQWKKSLDDGRLSHSFSQSFSFRFV
eukprot:COSAG02_NODE_8685_length_2479_cov_1.989496_2_plen_104_part_00